MISENVDGDISGEVSWIQTHTSPKEMMQITFLNKQIAFADE